MTEYYTVYWRSGLDYLGKDMYNLIAVCTSVEKCEEVIDHQYIDREISGEPHIVIGTRLEYNIDKLRNRYITHIIEKITIDELFSTDLQRIN